MREGIPHDKLRVDFRQVPDAYRHLLKRKPAKSTSRFALPLSGNVPLTHFFKAVGSEYDDFFDDAVFDTPEVIASLSSTHDDFLDDSVFDSPEVIAALSSTHDDFLDDSVFDCPEVLATL